MYKILAINPGSTSTKIAVFEDYREIFIKKINHSSKELSEFKNIISQFAFRKEIIISELKNNNIPIDNIDAVMGRGGLIKPIKSGVYEVNESLANDLKIGLQGEHASNLGGLIAQDIANDISGARAFIANPVVVDEFQDIARISGNALFKRKSIFHALNQKAVARFYAESNHKHYEDLNLIIAHLGGGVSVGAHRKGFVIDVNDAFNGEGPFSPERSGGLPALDLVNMCFSGKTTLEEMKKQIVGQGGFVSYLGTNDGLEVEKRALSGDDKTASLVFDAFGYQVAKEIGAMSTVLKGKVDAIIITGGLAYSNYLTNYIMEHVKHLGNVVIKAGEGEMTALAINGLWALSGKLKIKQYI